MYVIQYSISNIRTIHSFANIIVCFNFSQMRIEPITKVSRVVSTLSHCATNAYFVAITISLK